jgi:hypothetical protein
MVYITPAEFPAIRAALDISLDASNLPDAVINLPMYAGQAELWIVANDPLAPTYTPGSEAYIRTTIAAIYACAAYIVPALPNITSESYGDAMRYTRKEADMAKLEAALWTRARGALPSLAGSGADGGSTPPARFVFTLASNDGVHRVPTNGSGWL